MQLKEGHIFYYVFGALLLITAIFFSRAEIATIWWELTHTYPEKVLAINPDPSLALQMGQYYFDVGSEQKAYDIDRAEHFYTKALELDHNAFLAWHQLARISFLRGEQVTALYRINKQIALTGDDFMNVYYVRGLIHGFRGQIEKAVADFETYATWDVNGWYTYNDLAWLYFRDGRFEESVAIAELGLEKNPTNPWLLMSAGIGNYNLGYIERARDQLARAEIESRKVRIEDWRAAYPGNDPRMAEAGLAEFKKAIETNLALVNNASTTDDE